MTTAEEHRRLYDEFMAQAREDDPERVAELEGQYPTLSRSAWRTAQRREQPVGLLGLAPAFISVSTANEYGVESVYSKEEEWD